MDSWVGFGCLGAVCLAPIAALVAGYLLGKNALPFSIRIERNHNDDRFAVDDELLKRI